MNGDCDAAGPELLKVQLERAFRLLNKSLETFYEKRYERAVELCAEALEHLLPGNSGPPASPEQKSDLFLRTFSAVLPVTEADGIASVFTFFQNRRSRFSYRQGGPLPDRDWWQFIRIGRDEAEEIIQTTRRTVNAIQDYAGGGS